MCGACIRRMERHLGGADVELTLLFADLRGSTALAGQMTPTDYRSLVNDFYAVAARDIEASGGIVNKYLGDGVFAIFVPGFSGSDHAQRGIEAARRILQDTEAPATLQPGGNPLAVGIGLHTGTAYVGVLGEAGHLLDFTALGDAVNLTERLSSAASAREILISDDAMRAGGGDIRGLTLRELHLKGIDQPVAAWSGH